ncbi:MAG TPA: Dabb family protein [Gemmatimonadales bacterium]|jgi:hypothetical protein|nr:Dabb family protein [Gemmatimonadales bacterium]
MILHVILFRFKPGIDAATIQRTGEALLAMKAGIPEVRRITWGPNLAPGASEWPYVLTVTVDDMAAVQRYLDHPVHVETIANHVAPIRDGRLAIDIEL